MGKQSEGFIFALLSVLCSSCMALFVKLSYEVPISMIVFSRFVLGVPIFIWVVQRYQIRLHWKDVPKNLIRSFSGIFNLYAFYFALHFLPLVNAITLSNTAPLFLPFLTFIWLKVVISKRRFLAILLGFLGVLVILRPTTSEFLVLGSILGLLSGFSRAVALLNVRILAKTETTETILSYYFFTGAILSFIPLLFEWKAVPSTDQWIYVFLSGAFALAYQYMFTRACAYLEATKVSSINYLGVVIGAFFGWLVFREIPSIWFVAGATLIVMGALMALFDQSSGTSVKRRKRSKDL